MLGDKLNRPKLLELSKSSIMDDEMDHKRLLLQIQEKDRLIRKLTLKMDKLQEALSRNDKSDEPKKHLVPGQIQSSFSLQPLRAQIQKNGKLQEIIEKIFCRLKEISQDFLENEIILVDNQEVRKAARKQVLALQDSESNFQFINEQIHYIFNLQNQSLLYMETMSILLKVYRHQILTLQKANQQSQALIQVQIKRRNQQDQALIEDQLKNHPRVKQLQEEARQFKKEFQQEKKRSKKLKLLLQRSQYENNQQVNRINKLAAKQQRAKDIQPNQQLLKETVELKYRAKCLEEEKDEILRQSMKEKAHWNSKYKSFLKSVRGMKNKIVYEEQFIA